LLLSRGRIVCEVKPKDVTLEHQRATFSASEPPKHARAVSRKIELTRFSYQSATRAVAIRCGQER
jgi:hypothetical protein